MGLLNKKSVNEFEDLDLDEDYSYKKEGLDEFDETWDDFETRSSPDAEKTRILIETDSFINRIQLTLENKYIKKIKKQGKDGKTYDKQIPTQIEGTEPLLNEEGLNQVLGILRSFITHVISNTNIKKDDYDIFASEFIEDFTKIVISNRKDWGIKEENLKLVRKIYTINPVILFLTKAIEDKDRQYNYGNTLKPEEPKSNSPMDRITGWYRDKYGKARYS